MSAPQYIQQHYISFRVYYEDTDAGQVVYYANYLHFTERARTEWLRNMGYSASTFRDDYACAFVVKSLCIDYVRSARLDDIVWVHTFVTQTTQTSIQLVQNIHIATKNGVMCAKSQVTIVAINTQSGKPMRIPSCILVHLR